MTYNPNIPLPTDDLSVSQPQILGNFSTADTIFGVNHYKFSDGSANKGKHNNIQTPLIVGSAHPVTPATELAFYAMQDTANVGLLQYSRGPNSAVPTPVTSLQSQTAAIVLAPTTSTNILDFTGLARAFGLIGAVNSAAVNGVNALFFFSWNGASFINTVINVTPTNALQLIVSGNILQLKNASLVTALNDVYWTLDFMRIQ